MGGPAWQGARLSADRESSNIDIQYVRGGGGGRGRGKGQSQYVLYERFEKRGGSNRPRGKTWAYLP